MYHYVSLTLQEGFNQQFFSAFDEAVEAYFKGDWAYAKIQFESALTLQDDGPAKTILNYIKQVCPSYMIHITAKSSFFFRATFF